jgi:hypothetical protein
MITDRFVSIVTTRLLKLQLKSRFSIEMEIVGNKLKERMLSYNLKELQFTIQRVELKIILKRVVE